MYKFIYTCSGFDWSKFAEGMRCNDGNTEIPKGKYSDIQTCADQCRDVATMFRFQRNCDHDGCECSCEAAERFGRTCPQRPDVEFNLYKFPRNYCFYAYM